MEPRELQPARLTCHHTEEHLSAGEPPACKKAAVELTSPEQEYPQKKSLSFRAPPQRSLRSGSLHLAKTATCATCVSQWSRDAAASHKKRNITYRAVRNQVPRKARRQPQFFSSLVPFFFFFAFECKWELKQNSVQHTTKDHDAAEAKCSRSFCESFNTVAVSVGDLPENKSAFPE